MAKKTKKQLEQEQKELIIEKSKSYSKIMEEVLELLNMYTDDDGVIRNLLTEEPEIYNEKTLKRHTLTHLANITRDDIELDLITGNTKIMQFYFDKFLDCNGIKHLAYGLNIKKGSKLREIPDYYYWTMVVDNDGDEPNELTSDLFKNRNLGLIQLMFKLSNLNFDEDLSIIDK